MRALRLEQGSPEWHEARRGVITGTKAQDLFAKLKSGKYGAGRANAVASLAMQRLNSAANILADGATIRRGHEYEDEAAVQYEMATGRMTEKCGFALHGQIDQWGCSPDRLVGDDGVLEIKVPTSVPKHVTYCLDPQELLAEYEGQCRHNLFITGREWIDIVSYHPEAKTGLHLAKARMVRPASWAEYMEELNAAEVEIEAIIQRLMDKAAAA